MVSAGRSPVRGVAPKVALAAVAAILLSMLVLLLLIVESAAAGTIQKLKFNVEEEFTLQIDEVGDAKCTDLLKYERAFFNTKGFTFEKYPSLLERRFRDYADIREITDFTYEIDRPEGTISLAFDSVGKAYNKGDFWIVYGFASEPRFTIDDKLVFESTSTVNNEFTLWQDLDFKTTTYLVLPAKATDVQYDADKSAVTYKLAYVAPSELAGSLLQRNGAVFIPLFAVLLVASLAVLALLVVREWRARPVLAPAAAGGAASAKALLTPSGPAAPVAPPAAAAAEDLPAVEAPAGVTRLVVAAAPIEEAESLPAVDPAPPIGSAPEPGPRFCGYCGTPISSDEFRFCPRCGKDIG